jgi:hypothetical protein
MDLVYVVHLHCYFGHFKPLYGLHIYAQEYYFKTRFHPRLPNHVNMA